MYGAQYKSVKHVCIPALIIIDFINNQVTRCKRKNDITKYKTIRCSDEVLLTVT